MSRFFHLVRRVRVSWGVDVRRMIRQLFTVPAVYPHLKAAWFSMFPIERFMVFHLRIPHKNRHVWLFLKTTMDLDGIKNNNWLVVWLPFFIFPYIGFLIIPIDFHIFQRGGPTTNQNWRFFRIFLMSSHRDITGTIWALESYPSSAARFHFCFGEWIIMIIYIHIYIYNSL